MDLGRDYITDTYFGASIRHSHGRREEMQHIPDEPRMTVTLHSIAGLGKRCMSVTARDLFRLSTSSFAPS